MNIFQTQMDLSNEVKQLSPVKLPRYDVEGEKIHICEIFDQKLFPKHHKNIPFNSSEFPRIPKRRREALHRKTVFSHFQKIHTDLETGKACNTELYLFKHSCVQEIPGFS